MKKQRDQMEYNRIIATKMLGPLLPKAPDIVAEIDNRYKEQLQVNDIRKVELIQTYAQDLERKGEMPINQICRHMKKVLRGIVTPRHIEKSLTGEFQRYKDADQSAIGLKGRTSSSRMAKDYKIEEIDGYTKYYLIQIVRYLHHKVAREKKKV